MVAAPEPATKEEVATLAGVLAPLENRGVRRVVPAGREAYRRVRDRRRTKMATIVVGTDTSAAADLAVNEAGRLARANGAELVVLLVRPDGDLRAVVDPSKAADPERHLAGLIRRFPDVTVTTRIERGDAAERIVEVADELKAETIVVGNRGTRGSWWKVKDSVPNLVLRHAPCSVYIVDTRRAQ
jgi:nucleotide-binding universal stress UspA family protein